MYVYLVFFGIFWYSLTLETLCRPDLKTELEDTLVLRSFTRSLVQSIPISFCLIVNATIYSYLIQLNLTFVTGMGRMACMGCVYG